MVRRFVHCGKDVKKEFWKTVELAMTPRFGTATLNAKRSAEAGRRKRQSSCAVGYLKTTSCEAARMTYRW